MNKLVAVPTLFLLGACAGVGGLPSSDTCETARAGLHNAELIRDGIGFTAEHQVWADAAVFTASTLVNQLCPLGTPPLPAPAGAPVLP